MTSWTPASSEAASGEAAGAAVWKDGAAQSREYGAGDAGLGAAAAIGLALAICLAAGLADAFLSGRDLSAIFGAGFVLASLLAAVTVRPSRATATLVAPPLVYVVAVAIVAGVHGDQAVSSTGLQVVEEIGFTMATGPAWFFGGVAGGGLVSLWRFLNRRAMANRRAAARRGAE